jgi:hypothetical protein
MIPSFAPTAGREPRDGIGRFYEVARVATVATIIPSTVDSLATVAIGKDPVAAPMSLTKQGSSRAGHRGHRPTTDIKNPSVVIDTGNEQRVARSILSFEVVRVARVATRLFHQRLIRSHLSFATGHGGYRFLLAPQYLDRRSRAPPQG